LSLQQSTKIDFAQHKDAVCREQNKDAMGLVPYAFSYEQKKIKSTLVG
jgi:hypothetical protein